MFRFIIFILVFIGLVWTSMTVFDHEALIASTSKIQVLITFSLLWIIMWGILDFSQAKIYNSPMQQVAEAELIGNSFGYNAFVFPFVLFVINQFIDRVTFLPLSFLLYAVMVCVYTILILSFFIGLWKILPLKS